MQRWRLDHATTLMVMCKLPQQISQYATAQQTCQALYATTGELRAWLRDLLCQTYGLQSIEEASQLGHKASKFPSSRSLLECLASRGKKQEVFGLIWAGAQLDTPGLLQWICRGIGANTFNPSAAHKEMLNALLSARADVNIVPDETRSILECQSSLMIAVDYSDASTVTQLLTVRADTDIQTTNDGSSALMLAVTRSDAGAHQRSKQNDSKIGLLISGGADLDLQDLDGQTALMRAVNGPRPRTDGTHQTMVAAVKALIQAKANLDLRDNLGKTALAHAAGATRINYGRRGDWYDPKEVEGFCTENVKLLVRAGADVNIEDSNGISTLDEAARRGLVAMAQVLVKGGATSPDAQKQLDAARGVATSVATRRAAYHSS